jgi:hypothetical protein
VLATDHVRDVPERFVFGRDLPLQPPNSCDYRLDVECRIGERLHHEYR